MNFLVVRAGGRSCAFPIGSVVEAFRPMDVKEVPDSPACVRGLAIVRGEPVLVLDLATLIGGEPEPIGRFVVLRGGSRRVAVAVTSVVGVQVVAANLLSLLPPLLRGARADVVAQIGTLDRELLSVIEPSRLLDAEAWTHQAPG